MDGKESSDLFWCFWRDIKLVFLLTSASFPMSRWQNRLAIVANSENRTDKYGDCALGGVHISLYLYLPTFHDFSKLTVPVGRRRRESVSPGLDNKFTALTSADIFFFVVDSKSPSIGKKKVEPPPFSLFGLFTFGYIRYSNIIGACIEKKGGKNPETWSGKTLDKKTRRQKTLDLDQRETFLSRHFSSSGPHWWLGFGLLSVCTAWKAITNKEETKTKQKPKEEEGKKEKTTSRKIIYTKAFSL